MLPVHLRLGLPRKRARPSRLHRPRGKPPSRLPQRLRSRHVEPLHRFRARLHEHAFVANEDVDLSKQNMNASGIPLKEPSVSATAADAEQVERALIDASTRVPVLMFYASAIVWLLLGTVLAGFTSFKLHSPDLLSNVSFLTWGRIRPAHLNVMLYGWGSNVGMGTAIWLMARLCRTTL